VKTGALRVYDGADPTRRPRAASVFWHVVIRC